MATGGARVAIGLALVAALTAGCAGIEARTDYDRTVSFDRLGTWAWGSTGRHAKQARAAGKPFVDSRIRAAIASELAQRGYVEVAPRQADFRVSYQLLESSEEIESFTDFFRYRQSGGSEGMGGAYANGYRKGTLVVDITDPRGKQLWWRGSVSTALEANPAPSRIEEGVHAMLSQFPPR